jgi:CDP-diacylglycerol--glycerol-3-phosphate 3-phosphatidyltransferase
MTPKPGGNGTSGTWLNWPNRITIARIILVVPLVICLLNLNSGSVHWRHAAVVLFVAMALSDGLDGFLARRMRAETPIGRFLDPVADKLLVTSAVILLSIEATAIPGFQLPSWVPVIAIGKDVLTVIGFLLVYAVTGQFFVRPRIWGKACTLLQLLMIGYGLVAPELPGWAQRLWPAMWWLASAAAVIALVDYVRIGNRFAAEPK